jgi:hypothetical protein
VTNFGEVSRSLACSAELAKNQTEVYARLAAGPLFDQDLLPKMDVRKHSHLPIEQQI